MAKILDMPKLSPTMEEGQISAWHKKVGDSVGVDDLLAEVETDKATMEFRSFDKGTLLAILVPDGSVVKLGQPVAIVGAAGEDVSALVAQAGAASAKPAEAAPAPAATTSSAAHVATAAPAPAPSPAASTSDSGRPKASPYVRKLARERGLALGGVEGSGPGGRIVARDLDSLGASSPAHAAPRGSVPRDPAHGDRSTESRPLSMMRKTIARRLTESKQTVPHFYLTIDCDVGALLVLRAALEAQAGFKPSLNDFLVKAVALALKEVPAINASWSDDAVQRHAGVDVSVAVATPGGLVTPIVRDADAKSLRTIGAEIRALAERARAGPLKAHEIQGGSFTISNLGMYGIREFSAIVNPPQSCILAVGASEQRAVVRDGALAVATLTTCTLSADHRLVDGVLGAEFMGALRRLVEAPLSLLA